MNNRKEFLKYAVHDRGMSSHTVEDYISKTHGPIAGPDSMTRTVILIILYSRNDILVVHIV